MRKPQGSSFKICFDLKDQGEATPTFFEPALRSEFQNRKWRRTQRKAKESTLINWLMISSWQLFAIVAFNFKVQQKPKDAI